MKNNIIVIKWGGAAINLATMTPMVKAIVGMYSAGMLPVIIHGGGPEITRFCNQLNIPVKFVDGQRYTDSQTLEIVQMSLFGKTNRLLVTAFNQENIKAIGLTGQDAAFLEAAQWHDQNGNNLGYVGQVTKVNTELLELLLSKGFLPIISPIAIDTTGQAYNINADLAAGAIAGALRAKHLIIFSDVNGFYADPESSSSRISTLTVKEIKTWLQSGKIVGGMIPKLQACLDALKDGVTSAHILEGKNLLMPLTDMLHSDAMGSKIIA